MIIYVGVKRSLCYYIFAGVAQSVEQLIRNQQVAGSNPVTSSINHGKQGLAVILFEFTHIINFLIWFAKNNSN